MDGTLKTDARFYGHEVAIDGAALTAADVQDLELRLAAVCKEAASSPGDLSPIKQCAARHLNRLENRDLASLLHRDGKLRDAFLRPSLSHQLAALLDSVFLAGHQHGHVEFSRAVKTILGTLIELCDSGVIDKEARLKYGPEFLPCLLKLLGLHRSLAGDELRQVSQALLILVQNCSTNSIALEASLGSKRPLKERDDFWQCLKGCGDLLVQLDLLEVLYRCARQQLHRSKEVTMVCGSDVTQEFREHFLEVSRKATGPIMSQPGQLAEELHILAEELNSSLGGDATVRSYQPLRVEVSEGFIHPDATEEQLRERGEGLSQRLTVHRGGILFSFRAGRGSRDWVEIDMRHSEINVYVAQEAEQVDGANIPDSRPKAPKGRRDKKARPTGLSGQKVIIRLLSESEEPKAAPSNTSGDLTPVPSPPQAQGTLEIWLSPDDAKSLKSLLPPFCGPSLREHEPIGERASDVAGEKPRVAIAVMYQRKATASCEQQPAEFRSLRLEASSYTPAAAQEPKDSEDDREVRLSADALLPASSEEKVGKEEDRRGPNPPPATGEEVDEPTMRPELQGVIEVAEEGTDGEEETVMCGQPVAENLEEIGQEEKKERKKANEAAGAGRRVGKEGMMCRSSALAEAGQEEGTKPMTRAMWRRLEQRQRGEGDGSSRVPRPQREEEGLQVQASNLSDMTEGDVAGLADSQKHHHHPLHRQESKCNTEAADAMAMEGAKEVLRNGSPVAAPPNAEADMSQPKIVTPKRSRGILRNLQPETQGAKDKFPPGVPAASGVRDEEKEAQGKSSGDGVGHSEVLPVADVQAEEREEEGSAKRKKAKVHKHMGAPVKRRKKRTGQGNQAAIAPNADLRHVEVMDRLARQLTAPDSEEEEGQERGSPGAEEPLEEEAERGDEEEGDQPLVMRRSRGQEDPYNKRQEITAGSATSKRRKADEDDGLGLRIGLGREDMGEMTLEGMTKEKRVCNRARDWGATAEEQREETEGLQLATASRVGTSDLEVQARATAGAAADERRAGTDWLLPPEVIMPPPVGRTPRHSVLQAPAGLEDSARPFHAPSMAEAAASKLPISQFVLRNADEGVGLLLPDQEMQRATADPLPQGPKYTAVPPSRCVGLLDMDRDSGPDDDEREVEEMTDAILRLMDARRKKAEGRKNQIIANLYADFEKEAAATEAQMAAIEQETKAELVKKCHAIESQLVQAATEIVKAKADFEANLRGLWGKYVTAYQSLKTVREQSVTKVHQCWDAMEGCVSRLEQQSSKSLKKGKEQLADVQRIHSSLAGVAKILSAAL